MSYHLEKDLLYLFLTFCVFLGVRLCEFDEYSVTDDTSSLFLTTVSFAVLTVLLIEIC